MFPLHLLPVDRKRKIFGHDSILIDDLHTRRFQVKAELAKGLVFVQFGAVEKAACPGKDGRNWVSGRFSPLLIFSVVPGYSAYTTCYKESEVNSSLDANSPCAASLSITCPSGVMSSLVIMPRLPKPWARISL